MKNDIELEMDKQQKESEAKAKEKAKVSARQKNKAKNSLRGSFYGSTPSDEEIARATKGEELTASLFAEIAEGTIDLSKHHGATEEVLERDETREIHLAKDDGLNTEYVETHSIYNEHKRELTNEKIVTPHKHVEDKGVEIDTSFTVKKHAKNAKITKQVAEKTKAEATHTNDTNQHLSEEEKEIIAPLLGKEVNSAKRKKVVAGVFGAFGGLILLILLIMVTSFFVIRGKDKDGDGLKNVDERNYGTDRANTDTDGDGLNDFVEVNINYDLVDSASLRYPGYDPLVLEDHSTTDFDVDGLYDINEQNKYSITINKELVEVQSSPFMADTDSDSVNDSDEFGYETNPSNPDSDGDGLNDGIEIGLTNDGFVGYNPAQEEIEEHKTSDADEDGLTDHEEIELNTNPTKKDSDSDGLEDKEELEINTNPNLADSDGDTLSDGDEVNASTNPLSMDSDLDNLFDNEELANQTDANDSDSDDDGLNDGTEVKVELTDPNDNDSDNDDLLDGEEVNTTHTEPLLDDSDNDGLKDGVEVKTELTDPNDEDSDDDLLKDGIEVHSSFTDPKDNDSDDDLLFDGEEVNTYITNPNEPDTDGDLLTDGFEVIDSKTDPKKPDTDGDSLTDGSEVNDTHTNALKADSDEDGLNDYDEIYDSETDPWVKDTDLDGIDDGVEVNTALSDPLNADQDGDDLIDGIEYNGWDATWTDENGQVQTKHVTSTFVGPLGEEDGDSDDLSDWYEYERLLDPSVDDTDGDGLEDGEEENDYTLGGGGHEIACPDTCYVFYSYNWVDTTGVNHSSIFSSSNANAYDSDMDGLSDNEERILGADNSITGGDKADSDGDGINDSMDETPLNGQTVMNKYLSPLNKGTHELFYDENNVWFEYRNN